MHGKVTIFLSPLVIGREIGVFILIGQSFFLCKNYHLFIKNRKFSKLGLTIKKVFCFFSSFSFERLILRELFASMT